jgi:hypothetical protein
MRIISRQLCKISLSEDGYARFQVLIVANMKMIVFCDIALCSLVEVDFSEVVTASMVTLMVEIEDYHLWKRAVFPSHVM